MKKILLAFDGSEFSRGAFEFVRQLNDIHPLLVTGVFLPQLSYANLWSYTDAMTVPVCLPLLENIELDPIENNIDLFKDLCERNNIQYSIHKDYYDFALPELKRETRFADLLVIGSESFYDGILGQDPTEYMKDALRNSECPVIVVPENYKFPRVNILAYDGSESSVYAIKQFIYLFPELSNHETIIVYTTNDEDEDLPCEENIKELAYQHFMDVALLKINAQSKAEFTSWVNHHQSSILVSGSCGRSFFSELFKKSFITNILTTHKMPIFIAHK